MSDAIDKAAAAFDTDMGRSPAPTPTSRGGDDGGGQPEPMFANMGDLEVDEDSPAVAGGDGDRGARPRRAKAAPKDDGGDIDPEDALYNGIDPEDPEGDEGDEGDDGDEDSEGDEDPEDDEGDEDLDLESEVEVTIDGTPAKVTVREAIDGYIRTETFHRRLNEVHEMQTVVEREAGVLVNDRKKYIGLLEDAEAQLSAILPPEPNWDELFAKDGVQARRLQKSYAEVQERIAGLRQKRADAEKEAAEKSFNDLRTFAERERRKFEAKNPHWGGPEGDKKRATDLSSMARTAKAVGFTDAEILQVYDSRMLEVLLKASKYDRIMASRPKPKPRGKTPATPGAGNSRTAPRGLARANKQLQRTGSVEDAAAVFSQLLTRG